MKYIHANCEYCKSPVTRKQRPKTANVRRHFCNLDCKAAYQRLAKPVTKEWLFEQYVTLGRDTSQIGLDVGRDPKSVWNWLKDFGIPTRLRGSYAKRFLRGRVAGFKHSEATKKKLSDNAKARGAIPYDPKVGPYMKGKRGAETPNWKGGITAERQSHYGTPEWIRLVNAVWARDKKCCQRCGKKHSKGEPFDVHHIVSFQCKELRSEITNLVLLCERCHYWVHSRKNTKKEFIKAIQNAREECGVK